MKLLRGLLCVVVLIFAFAALIVDANAAQTEELWTDVSELALRGASNRDIIPQQYRLVAADTAALRALLDAAPLEGSEEAKSATTVLALPLPDGTMGRFSITEYAMMEAGLAAQFPDIRTYLGQGVDDPAATARLDFTSSGFHAQILAPSGAVYIDPYRRGDTEHYISYNKSDFWKPILPEAGVDGAALASVLEAELQQMEPMVATGDALRIYRLAVAATGEYTQFHGGTVNAAMAAIVTTMNRVNGIFEQDVALRMTLVDNNSSVVYTNPATDPYTNGDPFTMLVQNQANLDLVIGSANYDIGHVFGTNSGGLAGLGVTCQSGNKARGVTGSGAPVGDPFDIDYVAHEMGHQFGANHTFNGTSGFCSGNRESSAAYEPGSGSTIMGYAGICDGENLQSNSDAYFHTHSIDEIVAYTTTSSGATCPTTTATGNTVPLVEAGLSYNIPEETPFVLTGVGSDGDGDTLTYAWEEYDLGPASPPNSDNDGQARPIFRSFNPTTSPQRTFPRLSDLLNNTTTFGEDLPSMTRTITFRLTARDNRAGGGGTNQDSMQVFVADGAGPFLVTAPNTAVSWEANSTQTVTWAVANTDAAPVSCATVDILLSTDGGNTFATPILSGTANDGAAQITVPNAPTNTARVRVQCATNIFFDISNANFTITPPLAVTLNGFESYATEESILLQWETASELNNSGFHLYRSTDLEATPTLLTDELIPSQAQGSNEGFAYQWADTTVTANTTYYYWLESVSQSGQTERFGPVSATVQVPTALTMGNLGTNPASIAVWPWAFFGVTVVALTLQARRKQR